MIDGAFLADALQMAEGGSEGETGENCLLSYETNGNDKSSDNFCSEIQRIVVKFRRAGQHREKCLLLKIPFNVPVYDVFEQCGMYDKESLMYNRILPVVSKLLNSYISPRSYRSSNPKIIILDDLKEAGYRMVDRREQLDFDHSALALRTLAKFHAATYCMNETLPEEMEPVKTESFFNNENYYSSMIEKGIEHMSKSLSNIDEVAKELCDKVNSLKTQLMRDVPRLFSERPGNSLNVLNHGDFWTCNMLFRYDDHRDNDGITRGKSAVDLRMIDFQNCRWCSPAVDLIYFLTVSVKFDMFVQNLDDLLDIYLTQLNDSLRSLNCGRAYSMAELKSQIEECRPLHIVFLCSFLNIILSEEEEAPTFKKDENAKNTIDHDALSSTYYGKRYKAAALAWLKYLNKIGLL